MEMFKRPIQFLKSFSGDQTNPFENSLACEFQWNYPIVNLGRNEIKSCCRAGSQTVKIEDLHTLGSDIILNSPLEREKRARMLLGEKVPSCNSCWVIESRKANSPRVKANRSLESFQSDLAPTSTLVKKLQKQNHTDRIKTLSDHPVTYSKSTNMLEIVLANTCDMKCMYCSHQYSSKWAQERLQFGEIKAEQLSSELPKPMDELKAVFLDWFREEGWESVKYINFLGGEPSLIPEFYELSQVIGQTLKERGRKDVVFSVVTNLNSTPQVFEKLVKHVKCLSEYYSEIDINVSIEAVGKKAEYIRYGLDWERWKQNFENLCANLHEPCRISLQMATNLLSVSSLPELIRYCWSIYERYQVPIHLRQNMVSIPEAHSPLLLTSSFVSYLTETAQFIDSKKAIVDPLIKSEFGEWGRYSNFLTAMGRVISSHELNADEKKLIREFFKKYDQRRNLNISEVFPEYSEFFNQCEL